MRSHIAYASVLIVSLMAASGCGSGGASFGAVALQPPVKEATPAGLKSSTYASLMDRILNSRPLSIQPAYAAVSTDLTTIKDRFFSPGPTDFIDRLGKIDSRLAELDTRHQQSARTCVTEEAKLWTPAGLPGSASFPMYFSCQEVMSSELTVLFGKTATHFYVAELQKKGQGPKMGVLAKASVDASTVEAWQFIVQDDDTTKVSWVHILADKTTKSIEIAAASQASGTGVGCGVRVKAMADYVYGSGRFGDFGAPSTNTCAASAPAATTPCANATSLEDASGSCTGTVTSFTVGEMTYQTLVAASIDVATNALIDTPNLPAGLTDFNTQSK